MIKCFCLNSLLFHYVNIARYKNQVTFDRLSQATSRCYTSLFHTRLSILQLTPIGLLSVLLTFVDSFLLYRMFGMYLSMKNVVIQEHLKF